MRTENLAKLAVAMSGIAWGLFWIPLRGLGGAGIDRFWAFVIFNALPALMVLPLFIARWRQQRQGGLWLFAIGLAMGLTQFFYSLSVLHTEIVRAMILFYFNPVWTTLMARFFLGEAITPIRWSAIAVAFAGMFISLGVDQGVPWPRNLGDWSALVAGVAWASSVVLLRHHHDQKPVDLFMQNFIWTGTLLVPLVLFANPGNAPPPGLVAGQLWWLLPFILLIAMPGVYLSMWAVPLLAPAIVGVLYMTEISAAAISSAFLSGEPFGAREISGITLITIAAILESLRDLLRQRKSTPPLSSRR
ncbi:MAG: DMT family transporter [Aestuariivirga sp.]